MTTKTFSYSYPVDYSGAKFETSAVTVNLSSF